MRDGEKKPNGGPFGWLRRIDDAVYAVEQAIVATALLLITVVVFVDVIARTIRSNDSKIGKLISKYSGIEDLAEKAWIDANVAPWVSLVLALGLAGFGTYTARRFARRRAGTALENQGREILIACGVAVLVVVGGYLFALGFEQLDSWLVYVTIFFCSGVGNAIYFAKTKASFWQLKTAVSLIVGGVLALISFSYVPEGYTWSKKVSLMLLLWVGMLSASICVYAGRHIRVEAAKKLVPENAQRFIVAIGSLATAGFCAAMTYISIIYIAGPTASDEEFLTEIGTFGGTRYVFGFEGMIGREGVLAGTDIPDWLGILSAPIGLGVAALRFTGASVSALLGGTYGADPPQEGMEEAEEAVAAAALAESLRIDDSPADASPSSANEEEE